MLQCTHNESPFGCASEAQSQMVDTSERGVCSCGACPSVRWLQECIIWVLFPLWALRCWLHPWGCHSLMVLWSHLQLLQCWPWPCQVRFRPPLCLDSEKWKLAWQTMPTKQPLLAPSISAPSLNMTCTSTPSWHSSAKASPASSQPQ